MPNVVVNGLTLPYEEMGSGQAIVFMPGARSPMALMRPIATPLSSQYRAVIYDRHNCGAADVYFGGETSEQASWADELAQMIEQLGLAPAYLGGWSAGCRIALLTAIRHPEVVKGLILGWVTGGTTAADRLSQTYYGDFIAAAEKGGMEAVAATPFFSERIAANPGNRARILAQDPAQFIAAMKRWEAEFKADGSKPVIGATEDDLRGIQVPVAIAAGDDDIHPTFAAQNLHKLLPNSEYYDPPISRAEWDQLGGSLMARDTMRAERCYPLFRDFLARVEAGRPLVRS